jgi:hypothetical protein
VVTVVGGTLEDWSGPTTVGGQVRYSDIFRPTADRTTPATVTIGAGAFRDSTGNLNAAASNTLSVAVDTTIPAAPGIRLRSDTFSATVNGTNADGITSRTELTTTNTENGAAVQYKVVKKGNSDTTVVTWKTLAD